MNRNFVLIAFLGLLQCPHASADVLLFGDKDVLGMATYGTDPVSGAVLEGLTSGAVTFGSAAVPHSFPFQPSPGEFPGTDRMFSGSSQTASYEGYSADPARGTGPQELILDYSAIVGEGRMVETFTLGIAADDFQFPILGQPFSARINGIPYAPLTSTLNGLSQTGPAVQFFSIGLPADLLTADHRLVLEIDNVGDGGDGWAIDFLTAGITTQAVPEPSCAFTLGGAGMLFLLRRRRLRA